MVLMGGRCSSSSSSSSQYGARGMWEVWSDRRARSGWAERGEAAWGCGAFSLDCWNNANDGFFLWWRIEYPYRHLALLGGSSGICGRPANPWLLTFHSLSIYTRQQVLFSTTFFSNFTSPSEVIPLRQTLPGFGLLRYITSLDGPEPSRKMRREAGL